MIAYCPACWSEISADASVCLHCGASLDTGQQTYIAKLIAALRHPEPLTQRRAAYLLGLMADPSAVDALIQTLTGTADVFVRGEAAWALGKIGGDAATAALASVVADSHESFIVRRAAAQGLEGRSVASE